MKSLSHVAALTLVTVGLFTTTTVRAQGADSLTKVKSEGSVVSAAAPVDTSVHKKHGLFGKLKSVAQNKTVQNIAKAAVCQAVPGGQYMLGAAEAAKAKTSVASGVANAQSCIPGMPGAAGMGGIGGLGGKGAIAGAAMGAAGALGGGGVGTAAASARMLPGMPGIPKMPGGATMTATAQGLAGMQTAIAQMNAANAATGGTGDISTEAAGEQLKLSGPVPDEIKKGKLTIKKIDWVHDNASVSPSTTQGFTDLMMSAGQAMKSAGGTYRVDVYMDKKYADAEIATLGPQRALVIVSLLQAGGQLGEAVVSGKVGKEKEQRVEIVRVK
ncbi:MAG: hypothetical protein M3Y30_00775 [Gemmatimonadota bacterium]|nr:hypothetical protein [Gemmatimonadota bacterium]